MYNAQRNDIIREKIKVSKLLSDHEKADWLNLLELMNDKQFGELEEILAAEHPVEEQGMPKSSRFPLASVQKPVAQAPSVPSPTPSELKQQIQTRPMAPTSAPVPPNLPVHPAAVTKPIVPPSRPVPPRAPAPTPKPPTPAPAPVQRPTPAPAPTPTPSPEPKAKIMPPLSHIANVPSGVDGGRASAPAEPPPTNYATLPAKDSAPKPAFSISAPEEIQNISTQTLRDYDMGSIVVAIRNAILEDGYFAVLQLVENSQLYSEYLESGKLILQNQKAALTQEEFEFVADLLRNMRFNRV